MKNIDELKTKLSEKGISGVKEEIMKALEVLLPLYSDSALIEIAKTLLAKYYDEHLDEVFGETMTVDSDKEINYTMEENTHTRSEGVHVKTDKALGTTKKTKKTIAAVRNGNKASNARDPLLEENYKKRVAVYISHLREHAKWFLGKDFVESLIKSYATVYTNNYNKKFGTNFALHYTAPKKDWETWYLAQQVAE